MLSIAKMSGNLEYYLELACADYYLQGGEPEGRWYGHGARRLGLTGKVDAEQLRNLSGGFSADGSRKLVQSAGKPDHQIGWDLTFSAPKSVSVMWAAADEQTRRIIEKAHRQAVQQTVKFAEKEFGFSRTGRGGESLTKAGYVMALFQHGSSRAGDANLHDHALFMNIGVDDVGKTRTIVSHQFYYFKMAFGAFYRTGLGHGLIRGLGVSLEQDGTSFRVKGISQSVCDDSSKRRQEILQQLDSVSQSSARAAQIATLETRRAKDVPPRQELFKRWQREFAAKGLTSHIVRAICHRIPKIPRPTKAIQEGFMDLADRRSIIRTSDIYREAGQRCQHQGVSIDRLIKLIKKQIKENPEIVTIGKGLYTSRDNLKVEQELIDTAERLREKTSHHVSLKTIEKVLAADADRADLAHAKGKPGSFTASWEQMQAISHLTQSPGALQLVSGKAGTGKTKLLKLAYEAWQAEGYKVLGACIGGRAAAGMQTETGIKSGTLAKLRYDLESSAWKHHGKQLVRAAQKKRTYKRTPQFKLNSKTVLVLDEAGMIGSKDLQMVLGHAEKVGAKVVLIGDKGQLQPIEAGAPFAALEKRLGSQEIQSIKRQNDAADRQVVADLSSGQIEAALRSLDERGRVHLAENQSESITQLVRDWSRTNADTSLILAGTHAEVDAINKKCQQQRIKRQEIKADKNVTIDGQTLHVGDRVVFTRRDKYLSVENGDFGKVRSINRRRRQISVELDGGTRKLINYRDYRDLKPGYCVTTHKAQGATVENAFVLTGGKMLDQHMGYVQLSRARNETHLYLDKHEAGQHLSGLTAALRRSQVEELAIDVLARHRKREQAQRRSPDPCSSSISQAH